MYHVPLVWAVVLGMYPTFRYSICGGQSEGGGGEGCNVVVKRVKSATYLLVLSTCFLLVTTLTLGP